MQGTQLRQSARLEPRGYDERVRTGLNEMSQGLVIADENADLLGVRFCGRAVLLLKLRFAATQQDHLHALSQNERQSFQQQIEPLLPGEPADNAEQEGIRGGGKTETLLQGYLVRRAIGKRGYAERLG